MKLVLTTCVSLLFAAGAFAEEPKWQRLVDTVTSASLAAEGAYLISSSNATDEGFQIIVTFWKSGAAIYRCVDRLTIKYETYTSACFGPSMVKVD